MRGIDSIAKATTPRSRRRAIPSVSVSGSRKPTSDCSARQRRDELGGGARDAHDCLARRPSEAELGELRARLGVLVVGEPGRRPGTPLDANLEAGVAELRDGSGTSATRRSSAAVSLGTATRMRWRTLRRGGGGRAPNRHNDAQTSIFVRVRWMTSSVNAVVP